MSLQVNDSLRLQTISTDDHVTLLSLMSRIYPPAYAHYWKDGGQWYINSQYSKEILATELLEPNQVYFFVLYKEEIIGIIRILHNQSLKGSNDKKASKLHRIYLDSKAQGKGLGKQLLYFIEGYVKQCGSELLWLEVMKEQAQAFNFYIKLGYTIADEYEYEKELLFKEYRSMYAVYKELN